MNLRDEMIEIIRAYSRGDKVQWKRRCDEKWKPVSAI